MTPSHSSRSFTRRITALLFAVLCALSSRAPAVDWEKQAAGDAKQDRTTVAYDGITPNKMVCDTTLRELPDGTWILFMLAGGDTEPSPLNYTGVWEPMIIEGDYALSNEFFARCHRVRASIPALMTRCGRIPISPK